MPLFIRQIILTITTNAVLKLCLFTDINFYSKTFIYYSESKSPTILQNTYIIIDFIFEDGFHKLRLTVNKLEL